MEKIIGLMGAMREEIALLCELYDRQGGGNRCGRDVLHRACCRDAVWRFAARASAR